MTVLAAEEAAGAVSSARSARTASKTARAPRKANKRPAAAPAPTSSGAGSAAPATQPAGPTVTPEKVQNVALAGLPAGTTAAASTGSGFLLGVFAWALGLAYLRGGAPEVRRFMAAKFLNKTGG